MQKVESEAGPFIAGVWAMRDDGYCNFEFSSDMREREIPVQFASGNFLHKNVASILIALIIESELFDNHQMNLWLTSDNRLFLSLLNSSFFL